MPIRITGMNSGLDTEALISELVSAYRTKTQKYTKAEKGQKKKKNRLKLVNKPRIIQAFIKRNRK